MADTTIPNADPAILAAQAASGQAGVEAYKAAQAALQQQKQQAVQQALQEAASRGGPAGAMPSIMSTVTGAYDQRIASLAQGQAAFQGDMAARDRRMADYNSAVNAARSYIPEQTYQMIAPINAEADMRVRMIEREGEMDVQKIQQQMRLIEAQMAADAAKEAKKAGAASDKAMTPNATELQDMMFGRARDRLSSSTQGLVEQINANRANVNQSMAPVQRTLNDQFSSAAQQQSIRQGQNNISAGYITKGIAEAKRRAGGSWLGPLAGMFGGMKPAPLPPSPMGQGGGAAPQMVSIPRMGGFGGRGGGSINIQVPEGTQYPSSVPRPETVPDRSAEMARAVAKIKNLNLGWARPEGSNQVSSTNPNLGRLAMGIGRNLGTNQAYYERPFRTDVPGSNRQVFLSEDQLMGLDPFDRDMILGAVRASGQPLLNEEDFNQQVMGVADQSGNTSTYSPEVVQNALLQAAEELLGEGFNFGAPELANATEGKYTGMSIYDVLADAAGKPSAREEYETEQSRLEDAAAAEEEALGEEEDLATEQFDLEDEAAQMAAERAIQQNWGEVPPASFGTPTEIWDAIQSPAYDQAIQIIQGIVDANEDVEADEVDSELRSAGIQGIIRELALMGAGFK